MSDIIKLLDKLEDPQLLETDIISWGSPIISFGDYKKSLIATLGINPSNREFVDINGIELSGIDRRFHTLKSLGINDWSQITDKQLSLINDSFEDYFHRNPYDSWFKKLDYLISDTPISYYFPSCEACHLDLIPFATSSKWSDLNSVQKNTLLETSVDFLGTLLKNSNIQVLILNGKTVVDNLQKVSNSLFKKDAQKEWNLNRKLGDDVKGFSYSGEINFVGNIALNKSIKILGFNHNIQSSFGITQEVQYSIKKWLSSQINNHIYEL